MPCTIHHTARKGHKFNILIYPQISQIIADCIFIILLYNFLICGNPRNLWIITSKIQLNQLIGFAPLREAQNFQ